MGYESERVMNGTFGTVWVNNVLWAEVDEFEAKVSINYEDVNMPNELATHRKMTGYSGEGSLKMKKVYSRGISLLADGLQKGKIPKVTLTGKLADPDAYGGERVTIEGVTFNEFTLMKFQQKTLSEEELPFNFSKYRINDKVNG